MLAETYEVPEDKTHGGKRQGAGRKPKKSLAPFGVWAKSKGYTTTSLAKLLSVTPAAISQFFTGANKPGLELAVKISKLSEDSEGKPEFPVEKWVNSDT